MRDREDEPARAVSLSNEELDAVLTHEHAHWQQGRWWRTHVLFVIRLIQSYNPVALWAFREYCIEDEIACDAAAVAGQDPRLLARVLLRVFRLKPCDRNRPLAGPGKHDRHHHVQAAQHHEDRGPV